MTALMGVCGRQGNEAAESKRKVGSPEPKRTLVAEFAALIMDTLGSSRLDEVDVRYKDGDPGKQTEHGY